MMLRYRMCSEEDAPALARLWSENSGWDHIDAETWANRFLRIPTGDPCVVVAEEAASQEIVGQFVFFPCSVSIDGNSVPALRPFAPVLSSKARGSALSLFANPLNQPVVAMYRYAAANLVDRGVRLMYMVPDPFWVRLFRMVPALQTGSFPLWSLPLPLSRPFDMPDAYRVSPLKVWDDRVDRLARIAADQYGCIVVRDSVSLPWKLSHGDYRVLGIEHDGELVSIVASRGKGDRQWLICDLLTIDVSQTLAVTLKAVCNLAHEQSSRAGDASPIRKVAILATSAQQSVLTQLGFVPDRYKFPFVVHLLDKSLSRDSVAPSRWYLSAND